MAGTVAHVVGARPNFMKAAPVIRALAARGVDQRLIHTGQHYDDALSAVFFRDLDLPRPDLDLGVGSGSHAAQTAAIMVALERAFAEIRPALAVVYGDVNSTVAAALVAAKIGLPMAHVEAGLRSFDDTMPEEINRRVTDLLSELLFVTSPEGVDNLVATGTPARRIHFVGNPMIDTLLTHLERFDVERMRTALDLPERYAVATMHRPSNVDDPGQAARIVAMLRGVADLLPLIVPLHPRGRPTLEAAGLRADDRLRVVDPLGYVDFLSLVRGAALVVTDSGGIQEETTILKRALPDGAAEHGTTHHDQPRNEPARRCRCRACRSPARSSMATSSCPTSRRRSGTAMPGSGSRTSIVTWLARARTDVPAEVGRPVS